MKTAVRLIEHHDRTAADLRARLATRGYAADTIEEVLERLISGGYVDDRRYAERFAELAVANRGMGSRRIRMELVRRGVPKEMAIETGLDLAGDDRVRAEQVAERRVTRMKELAPDVATRRLIGFLARKGYAPDICVDVSKRMVAKMSQDAEAEPLSMTDPTE